MQAGPVGELTRQAGYPFVEQTVQPGRRRFRKVRHRQTESVQPGGKVKAVKSGRPREAAVQERWGIRHAVERAVNRLPQRRSRAQQLGRRWRRNTEGQGCLKTPRKRLVACEPSHRADDDGELGIGARHCLPEWVAVGIDQHQSCGQGGDGLVCQQARCSDLEYCQPRGDGNALDQRNAFLGSKVQRCQSRRSKHRRRGDGDAAFNEPARAGDAAAQMGQGDDLTGGAITRSGNGGMKAAIEQVDESLAQLR